MMVGNNLKDTQLQQIVDKTIINADTDGDGKISFEEFCAVRAVRGLRALHSIPLVYIMQIVLHWFMVSIGVVIDLE